MKPDKWIAIKITSECRPTIYKILAQVYGGYLKGDSWRLNSGIKSIEEKKKSFLFHGHSGSIYTCNKNSYGTGSLSGGILKKIQEAAILEEVTVEVLPKETDWTKIKFGD